MPVLSLTLWVLKDPIYFHSEQIQTDHITPFLRSFKPANVAFTDLNVIVSFSISDKICWRFEDYQDIILNLHRLLAVAAQPFIKDNPVSMETKPIMPTFIAMIFQ